MKREDSTVTGTASPRRRAHLPGGPRAAVAALVAASLVLAGCSTKAKSADGPATGPGVTKDTITLGVLTDLSGPFAALGKPLAQAHELYRDEINKAGGVCGRKIVLDTKDHGYDVQKAVGLYTSMSPKVLGMLMLVGSGVNAALKENVKSDNMFTVQGSFSSAVLDTPQYIIMGGTFDVDMINGISWLAEQKGLKSGDKIGFIYAEGEQGENNLLGAKFATGKLGIEVVTAKVTALENDMSSQVAMLKNAGVKAIVMAGSPTQTASIAAVNASTGLDVPLLGTSTTFVPQLLGTPAGPALEKNLVVTQSWLPFGDAGPGATAIRQAYTAKHKDTPNAFVTWAYMEAKAYIAIIEKACEQGDLTRSGLQKAAHQISALDTAGVTGKLNFSVPGSPPTRESLIAKADKQAPGGLTVVQKFWTSGLAGQYKAPTEKG